MLKIGSKSTYHPIKFRRPIRDYTLIKKRTPSEGIEPPASEPESEVLSITPRGHINKYMFNFSHYTDGAPYFQ